MTERPWKLAELDPGEKLDRRVRRRLRALTKSPAPARRAAPFLPLERAVYALVVAVYAFYTGARTVQVLHEARAAQARMFIAGVEATTVTAQRGRAPRRG
jgi:hypothetical protein